eukprot:GGOE01014025.1.p1 GENE.GGOE01014025.1~~GGOE01014025.1.p1  ORF type:complete len:389 (+),score=53.25 GGOE01014025.1:116-1168(+)
MVAVLFDREPRTLNYTICSLTTFVIVPLQEAGYRIVVFIEAVPHPTLSQFEALSGIPGIEVHMTVTNSSVEINPVCDHYLQKQIKFRQVHKYIPMVLTRYSMWKREDIMRRQYEIDTGQNFSWVFLLRADALYTSPIVLPSAMHPDAVNTLSWQTFGGVNDRFFAMRAQYASTFFNLYHTFCGPKGWPGLPRKIEWVEGVIAWHMNLTGLLQANIHNFFLLRLRMNVFTMTNKSYGCWFPDHDILLDRQRFSTGLDQLCRCLPWNDTQCTSHLASSCFRRFRKFLLVPLQGRHKAVDGFGLMPPVKDPWWRALKAVPKAPTLVKYPPNSLYLGSAQSSVGELLPSESSPT